MYRAETGRVEVLEVEQAPHGLGMLDEFALEAYGDAELTLAEGDLVLLVSDGIREAARNGDYLQGMFGEDRIVELLSTAGEEPLEEIKQRIAATKCTGEAGGGLVTDTVTGDYKVDAIHIGEGAMEDRELLEDLVRAALAEALRQVQEQMKEGMAELTGGLPIPPGLLPF